MPAFDHNSAKLSAVRSVLITLGVILLVFVQPNLETGSTGIVIGLAMQIVWWLALWAVRRYERNHQLDGALQPIVVFILELLIDAITVALFAHAVLSNWWSAGQAL